MNNYSNMNYYMPNNMTNIPNDYMSGVYGYQGVQGQMANDNMKQMTQGQNMNQNKQDSNLKKKLAKQAGDNMSFNMCDYVQKANPNEVFDVYGGFIRGNMFPDLYNTYKVSKPFDVEPLNEQAELLTYLDAYGFAAHDLNLYLDNNPNDRDMIELFNSYTKEADRIQKEYEKKYGPLFVNASNTYPWAWNDSPWPWEN